MAENWAISCFIFIFKKIKANYIKKEPKHASLLYKPTHGPLLNVENAWSNLLRMATLDLFF